MRFGAVTNETCRAALESAYVTGTNGIYFVGPFVERVSFASQQLRAFNLVWALEESGEVSTLDSVAVVGAGLSGVSASAGFLAKGAKVMLFEKESRELSLQKDTNDRYVHPTVNRWPVSSIGFTTELPFLDWAEGLCADVIDQVYQQWMFHFEHLLIDKKLNCEIIKFEETSEGCYLTEYGNSTKYGPFKCVVFATGFGNEVMLNKSILGSYWVDDQNFDNALPKMNGKLILSGLGDGALIEALRILFPQFNKGRFTVEKARFLAARDFTAKLLEIEKEAMRLMHDTEQFSTFIHNKYRSLIHELPKGFRSEINESIRKNIQIELIGPEAFPYIRNAAPMHQLLTTFAISNGALTHTQGWMRSDNTSLWIELPDGSKRPVEQKSHVCRLGPDRDLTALLNADQIEGLKKAQYRLSDFLFALPKDAFQDHKIKTCPQWEPTSKAFVASRQEAATKFMRDRFDINLSIDQEANEPCFGAAVPVEKQMNPFDLPDQLFGIDVKKKPIFEGEEFAAISDGAIGAGSLGVDPNRSRKIDALDVNSTIRRSGNQSSGRIGVFAVKNGSGDLYAATASHTISGGGFRRDKTIVDSTGKKIGFVSKVLQPSGKSDENGVSGTIPISTKIAWFRLSKDTYVRPTSFGARKSTFSTPLALLGSDVVSANRSFARGKIVSVDAIVRLKSFDSEQLTTYHGAMIVQSSGSLAFASKGDSGAVVNAKDGSPIGIIIGGKDDKVVVAPLGEALLESDLSIPNVDFIRNWNRRAIPSSESNDFASESDVRPRDKLRLLAKRAMDVVIALLALILVMPLLILSTIAIRMQDGGPAIFASRRIGRDGRSFNCFKFRSMVMDANERLAHLLENDPHARQEWNSNQKLKYDPRITPIGRFLRKTSIDELPQLLNVLKGDMSIVGPRPIVQNEVEKYGHLFSKYASVKPGLTGLWQVHSRSEATYGERVEIDAYYAENWTLTKDLIIMIQTVLAVLFSRGATDRSKL